MKTGRNVPSFTTVIIFLLTALGTQLAMAADPAGSTTSVWSPGKPLIILPEGGNVILRPGKCGFRLATNALFGIDVDGKRRDAFTMKGTSCEIAGDGAGSLAGVDMGYFPAGTELHFYHQINGWGGTAKTVYKASSRNLGTSSETFADAEVFTDRNKSLGFGGSVVERVADLVGAFTSATTTPTRRWVLHLDDAAGGDDDDDDVPIGVLLRTGGCPAGTYNLTYGGFAAGADIGGCGLDSCTARMGQKNVNECRDWCKERDDCKSFTWADTNEDRDWRGDQVCTRYGSATPNQRWRSTDGVHRQILCAYVKTGGLTVGSFSSATSTAAGTGQFNIYKYSNFKGKVNSYGIGQHEFHVGGDSKTMGSFKVPAGLAVTFYDAPGCKDERKKGRKSYGPFKGRFHGTKVTGSHGFTPRSIHCFQVVDISTKAKREAEAKKRAKLEADKKAAVAKAKAAAELAKKKEECKADVVFLMDNTGSMGSVISATKASAAKILNKIAGADPRFKGLNVKFGVATYWGDPKEHKCETKAKTKTKAKTTSTSPSTKIARSKATAVKLYQHWHYEGEEKSYEVGKHAWIGDTFSGVLGLSSFKIPKGLSVYLWQDRDFKKKKYGPYKGPLDIECLANYKGDGCPHSEIPNDHIQSIEVVKTTTLPVASCPLAASLVSPPLLPPKTKVGCTAYVGKQCYWMENTSGKYCWVPRSSTGFSGCKALDSCDGGGGLSGGGCYKFAECSDCKRMPWSGTSSAFSSADTGDGYQECARKSYKVNQPLTKSKASAASAMKQWKACSAPGGCGGDWPEANFFALQQLATEGEMTDGKGTSDKGFATGYKVGWREDAGRVVVWFGDAPSHTTTVDREEASQALLDNQILVTAINTQDKGSGMDSASLTYGTSRSLPHYCSVKTCEWGAGACDRYACETDGYCKTAWSSYYDCSLVGKPKPTGQATHIATVTRGTVHHKITGGSKVVKTILEAAAAGIADAGVGSAVTFNGSFLARDSQVFFGKMDPTAWSGDVQAWPLNEKTAAIDVAKGKNWSAAETMDEGSPASRVMLTYQRAVTDAKGVTTPGKGVALRWDELSDEQKADMQSNHKGEIGDEKEGKTRLSFLRGDRTDEGKGYGFRIRDSRLGDIWHSSPVHVGAPRKPRWAPRIKSAEAAKMFNAYLSFVRTSGGREPIVYVGANDGALHGFNANTGEEVLSYFPAALYASLKDSKGGGYHKLANPEYSHTDYVDATPSVFDAYLRGDGGSMEWRSVLVGSLGGGGRGFFGLDVTDPSAFSEANVDDIVLGEFSNADDDHLGYSYSKPRFGRMNNGRSAVIIGNGLDDTATDESGGQAQLFIVYLDGDAPGADGKWDLGKDYIRIATGKGSAEVGLRNGLFTPTIVDVNGDGTIDRAYAGDLQGNLWAFDLSGKSSGAWKVAMDKKPLLKAAGNRPITAAPLVVRPNHRAMGRTRRDMPGLMVAFGTGRFLKDRDKVYTDPQRFYAVYDRGVPIKTAKSQLVQQPLRQKTIETATGESRKIRLTKGKLKVPYSHPEFPKYGWYMNLPEKGERVVSEAKFQRGVVYFNSIVPDISVCSSGGEGWEMAVKLVNGGNPKAGNHDVNEDEKVDGDDAADKDGDEAPAGKRLEGRGMPTGPKLFGDRRFTASSKMEDGSDIKTTALERIDRQRQGRLSWEELKPRQQ